MSDGAPGLGEAARLQQAGRLEEAEAICRQALASIPEQPVGWLILGTISRQRGDHRVALERLGRAVALRPGHAGGHYAMGQVLDDLGRREEALASYQRTVAARPDLAEAHFQMGRTLVALGDKRAAVASYRAATAAKPGFAEAHNNLGNVLNDLGETAAATAIFRRALEFRPDFAEPMCNLGRQWLDQGRAEAAISEFRRAIELKPDLVVAHNNLGNALLQLGRVSEAVACYERALEIQPGYVEAHSNLGKAFNELGRIEAAIACYRQALRLDPRFASAHNNLAKVHAEQGHFEKAEAGYRQALRLQADHAEAHCNLGILLLTQGRYEQGWQHYAWRGRTSAVTRRQLPQPMWDGSPLEGRSILIYAEQGLGDTIQFIRYARQVKQRGGRVVVEVQPELVDLLGQVAGIDELVPRGELLPPCDLRAPLLGLPRILGTTLATIPAEIGYIRARPQLARAMGERLGSNRGVRVGLAWQGRPTHGRDRSRSVALGALEPLLAIDPVCFVSLQVGVGAEQIGACGLTGRLLDFPQERAAVPGAFVADAAIIENLDLVVSIDSAVAHLAGAMGKPTWIMLDDAPDWRWMRDRDDSPWYRSVRLFRQRKRGDWGSVVAAMATALAQMAARGQPDAGRSGEM